MQETQQTTSMERAGEQSEFDGLLTKPLAEREDLLRVRMENETIMAEARAHKRSLPDIKRELSEMLQAFPELAEDAIYRRPVGGGKIAVGLSIRAAETLAEAYGYNRVAASVTPIDADTVRVEATFTDFQRCRIWTDAGVCTAWYKASDGKLKRYSDDRFLGMMAKGEVARRVREVILRSVNSALKKWFENECHKVQALLLNDEKVDEIIGRFAEKDVPLLKLEAFIGRPASMGWTIADRQKLLGVWTAIKDNETTIAEAFPEPTGDGIDTTKTVQDLHKQDAVAHTLREQIKNREKTQNSLGPMSQSTTNPVAEPPTGPHATARSVEEPVAKRTRRTKSQMEADAKAASQVKRFSEWEKRIICVTAENANQMGADLVDADLSDSQYEELRDRLDKQLAGNMQSQDLFEKGPAME